MKINFTPGPSQLYFTVEDHMKKVFRDGIPSLSHRSKEFESIFQETVEGIKELLGVPDNYRIVFTASATEVWERSIENLVENNSVHYVNGAFSKRYFETAQQLGRTAKKIETTEGKGFKSIEHSEEAELIALTHNETSTGVSLSNDFINSFRGSFPNSLVVVDAVSSLPYPQLDYSKVDSVFFSVQKGFGLPAGLGVWLVNERCIAKAESILTKGKPIGSYHSLPSLISHAQKNQTPETPNVLGIYLLAKVTGDFIRRGISVIRKETEYKAAVLYTALEKSRVAQPFVVDKDFRSQTVIVANCSDNLITIKKALEAKGLYPGDGYGKLKSTQLRFANFPTHSKEHFELLGDTFESL